MSIAVEPFAKPNGVALSLRYALRELRGGLRGFYVFIACIALGVMAIAGVGSVSASLSDGLAREGRTLLGGDVSFVLFQREAKPEEVAFLRSRGTVSERRHPARHGALGRGQAGAGRDEGGRRHLSDARTVDAGAATADVRSARGARRRIRRRRRSDPAGAAVAQDRRPRHRRLCDLPDPQQRRGRARQARRRHRFWSALPDQRGGPARHRADPARQPGALGLPRQTARYRQQRPCHRRLHRGCPQRRAAGRLGGPQPLQCLAAARTQYQPLHAIPDPGRPRSTAGRRCRRRQCREEPYRPPARGDRGPQGRRRHGARRVRHLSRAGRPARRDRLGDWAGARRRDAVCHRRPVRKAAAAAGDPGRACRRARAVLRLRPFDRARLRPVAARTRARRAGRRAVPRHHQRRMAPAALELSRLHGRRRRAARRGRDRPVLRQAHRCGVRGLLRRRVRRAARCLPRC